MKCELALKREEPEPDLCHVISAFEYGTFKRQPTSVSHSKTVVAVFDPARGPKEPSTNKNAKEERPAFNSRKYEQDKAISISNNHFS